MNNNQLVMASTNYLHGEKVDVQTYKNKNTGRYFGKVMDGVITLFETRSVDDIYQIQPIIQDWISDQYK